MMIAGCGMGLGTTANQMYSISANNSLKWVALKNNIYCIKKVVNKKTTFVPLNPQPEHVLTVHRYYTLLKGNHGYKKRVTTMQSNSILYSKLNSLALIEYCGENTSSARPHGNSKRKENYIRTDPKVLEAAVKKTQAKSASEVCYEMSLDDSTAGPKSARQIQDKKYREIHNSKAKILQTGTLGDEVVAVLSELNNTPVVQKVIFNKGKPPSIILYSKEGLADLKSNCLGSGAVF